MRINDNKEHIHIHFALSYYYCPIITYYYLVFVEICDITFAVGIGCCFYVVYIQLQYIIAFVGSSMFMGQTLGMVHILSYCDILRFLKHYSLIILLNVFNRL